MPIGSVIGKANNPPGGEGYFIVMLGRRENGDRFANVLGTNMTTDEILEEFLKTLSAVTSGTVTKIGLA